ncbi:MULTISPECIES: hypothetical protein [Paenarthrobacter]|uniref:Secreted protein n=1 Tax=Paenarthrobacter ureafaciens TaxID=37931 RepID=A0AAX3EDS6_PAEUR|nr:MULTISPECIES: hypothetical protein [Paenarthrobacter]NKR13251.1 hypothetical protein [Arthrobacter sp. M5]NKR14899.1 hypothetical protein [Arthrobacter sp. M6]OEH62451.1 hypothetical protein A5N13_01985 [Arthrobacter sp. D4]OEH63022.1 hypothetical protein A5N17_10225 [Arthrobacter sp. D2]MDO5865202.1 hypothetical protein [Paenarthrobacter sp. SD-2]
MLPMTPLQSWAFIVLLLVFVLGLVWLVAEVEAALRRRPADVVAVQPPQAHEADSTIDPIPATRPALHLIQDQDTSQVSKRSRRGPTEVYDWARRGI